MPTNAFDPVKPGDSLRIHAEAWNSMLALARERRTHSVSTDSEGGTDAATPPATVLFKNTTASTLPRFGVVQLDGPVFDPSTTANEEDFVSRTVFRGVAPNASLGFGLFGVATSPVAAGKIGQAFIDGIVGIKIRVRDALHNSADAPRGADGLLTSCYGGAAEILWKQSGTGTRYAMVRLGRHVNTMPFLARITAASSSGTRRWTYSFVEVGMNTSGEFVDAAAGTSMLYSGGTGTDQVRQAYNTVEWVQSATPATIGPGITVANLAAGWDVQPIATNTVVLMHRVRMSDHVAYAFCCPNAVDGNCPVYIVPGTGGGTGDGGEIPLPA